MMKNVGITVDQVEEVIDIEENIIQKLEKHNTESLYKRNN